MDTTPPGNFSLSPKALETDEKLFWLWKILEI